jgi:hypothetical protein
MNQKIGASTKKLLKVNFVHRIAHSCRYSVYDLAHTYCPYVINKRRRRCHAEYSDHSKEIKWSI